MTIPPSLGGKGPMTHSDHVPWLRETVGDELAGLFGDHREDVSGTVGRILERIAFDERLQEALIDTLQTSIDHGNDETQGSVWITLILGEAAIGHAIPTLLLALSDDTDEELHAAAGIAILKCGSPGVGALVESIEEEGASLTFLRTAFELLGCVGYLRDEDLRRTVMEFLS